MRNLMVVEDESILRLGLRHMVDWEKYDVHWAAEASNGEEALNLIDSHEIHIVISDIRMPGMDGLQLARKLKESHPAVQVILLSSFDDFPYVKEALRIGVIDYLHKPTMAEEEIVESVQKALNNLKALSYEAPVSIHKVFSDKQKNDFLVTMLDEHTMEADWNRRWEQCVGLDAGKEYSLVIFRLHSFGPATEQGSNPENKRLEGSRFHSTRHFMEEYVSHDWGGVFFTREQREIVWIAPAPASNQEDLPGYLDTLIKKVREVLQVELSFAHSRIFESGQDLPGAYLDALLNYPMNDRFLSVAVRMAKKQVDTCFRGNISLAKVAGQVNVSPGHLSRLFFKEVGEHFVDYLTKIRIQHAKKQLKETNMKVYEISAELGYENPHYFSRLFKDLVGVTPLEYRGRK